MQVSREVWLTTHAYRSYEHPPLTGLTVHPNVWSGMMPNGRFHPDVPVRDCRQR